LCNEGPEILMYFIDTGYDMGRFILSRFKKEGFIIAMKFDYLGICKCHSILSAFVNKEPEIRVEMLVIGVESI